MSLGRWRIFHIPVGLCVLAYGGGFLIPQVARAGCDVAATVPALPDITSVKLQTLGRISPFDSGFECTGAFLNIASTNWVRSRITSSQYEQNGQFRLYNAQTGDYIPFRICKNSSCTNVMGKNAQVEWSSSSALSLLGLFGPSGSMELYVELLPGANVATGTYSTRLNFIWSWQLCSVGIGSYCLWDDGTVSDSIEIKIYVKEVCEVSAQVVDFGTGSILETFTPVERKVSVTCTKGTDYTVGVNGGLHGEGGQRHLSNGSHLLAYEIYQPANSQNRWGHLGAQRRTHAQADVPNQLSNGILPQNFTFRAEILQGQPQPPVGHYADVLQVDVQF